MSRSVKQEYPPSKWKAGDKAFAIKLDHGYLYVNKETADRYGLDLLSKINGSDIVEVTVMEP